MTFQKIYDDLTTGRMQPQTAYDLVNDQKKTINFYVYKANTSNEPFEEAQLVEVESIVNLLQVLYNSGVGSPISDSDYDTLEELLVNDGIPRLTGSVELNDSKKVSHEYTQLRGTLEKVYYLTPSEPRTNKSRRSLDDWLASAESKYHRATGKPIDMNRVKILCQCKYDGVSATLEWDGQHATWLSRGDTVNNRASDLSKMMSVFNDKFCTGNEAMGIKFECMCTEEAKDKINSLIPKPYKNSRQIVSSTLNSNEVDFKVNYLSPVPLRIIHPGDDIEQIHPDLINYFPTMVCTFGDREEIRDFANHHRYAIVNGNHYRTDGVVMTIMDPKIQRALGREDAINQFEVAYKFTEECAYTKVKEVEFYVSDFGYITPVLVVNDVILKGNTVNHISLSNKERFDELDLHYGDTVKVLYDIIPQVTMDENCVKQPNGRKIEFIRVCPKCHSILDLSGIEVQCSNPKCPSKIVGRVMNYCNSVRIKNIGSQTLEALYDAGFLDNGIRSLYKLRKHADDIMNLEGFGQIKTRKIISEIEAKRRLKDYEFFGALGIEGLSTKSFQWILAKIPLDEFISMIRLKNVDLLYARLVQISGIGPNKASLMVDYVKDTDNRTELIKLIDEVNLVRSYNANGASSLGRIVFTGCRPDDEMKDFIESRGYEASDSWINTAKMLVIPFDGYTSSKVGKAQSRNIPIVVYDRLKEELE